MILPLAWILLLLFHRMQFYMLQKLLFIETIDWQCEDCIRLVLVNHQEANAAIAGHKREVASQVVIDHTWLAICKWTKTRNVCTRFVGIAINNCWTGDRLTIFIMDNRDVHWRKHRRDDGDKNNNACCGRFWSCATYAVVGTLHVSFRCHWAWIKVLEDELFRHVWAPFEESLVHRFQQCREFWITQWLVCKFNFVALRTHRMHEWCEVDIVMECLAWMQGTSNTMGRSQKGRLHPIGHYWQCPQVGRWIFVSS